MNKRMIVNWLKDEQNRALAAVEAQADANTKRAYQEIWEEVKLSEAAPRLQKTIDDFWNAAKEFEKTLGGLDGVQTRSYNTLSGQVYTLADSTTSVEKFIKGAMVNQDCSPRFQRIYKARREMAAGVTANYTAAIENVKTLKDANAAMAYLEGLGFDLTTLKKLDEPKATTAVALPVDTRFLFLGGNA